MGVNIANGVEVVCTVIVEENVDVAVERVFNKQVNIKNFMKDGSLNNKLPLFMLWLFLPNYFSYQLALNYVVYVVLKTY
ncbi:hypothetical protein CON56_21245 [Bacillus thuringiensis]|nr:hypothetical protein CON56_21245 [Bacillus thuringiensis]PFO91810.1 hypothetical protein COJ97_27275 [Bacillus cereus]